MTTHNEQTTLEPPDRRKVITVRMTGETAKRELTFTWTRQLLTDLTCWLIGHAIREGEAGSVYCDRCWRWGTR